MPHNIPGSRLSWRGPDESLMKISFCTIAFQKNKWGKDRAVEIPLADVLPIIARAGYDGVEVWYPHVSDLSPVQELAIRGQLDALGLSVPMLSSYYDFTASEESAQKSVIQAREVLERAIRLKARALRIFTGGTGSASATPQQWDRAISSLQEIADLAAPSGILLACETHRANLMDCVVSSRELVRRVGRPNVGLILQPSTFKQDYLAACEALAPHTFHVHATNSRDGKGCALADGEMDWGRIIALLARHRFGGFVSIEWMGEDPAAMADREAAFLKGLA